METEAQRDLVGAMDMRWLEDFLAVADTRNFTRAARLRNISQAAFSRRIRGLEWWLGVSLIDRASCPLRLTPDGENFRQRAAAIVQQITDAQSNDPTSGPRRELSLALPHSLATGRLPAWWGAWQRAVGPDVAWNIVSGDVNDIVAALMTADIDILVAYQSAIVGVTLPEDQYERVEIGEEVLAPYAAPWVAERLERSGRAVPLLAYTPTSTFARVVEALLDAAPTRPRGPVIFEAESTAVLRAMAMAGHGVAWLPIGVANEAPRGALRRVEIAGWSADLKIIAHRDRRSTSTAVAELWSLLSPGGRGAPAPRVGGAALRCLSAANEPTRWRRLS